MFYINIRSVFYSDSIKKAGHEITLMSGKKDICLTLRR